MDVDVYVKGGRNDKKDVMNVWMFMLRERGGTCGFLCEGSEEECVDVYVKGARRNVWMFMLRERGGMCGCLC